MRERVDRPSRAIAYFIDHLIMGLIGFGCVKLGLAIVLILGAPPVLVSVIGFSGIILGVSYFLIADAMPFFGGQSLGKKLLKMQVVQKADGSVITGKYGTSFKRRITLLIPFLNMIEYLLVLFNQDRFGDSLATTTVVSVYTPK